MANGYIRTIPQKRRNKNVENGRGMGHVTLIKFGTLKYISKTSKATDFKFGIPLQVDNFYKMYKFGVTWVK